MSSYQPDINVNVNDDVLDSINRDNRLNISVRIV